MLIDLVNFIFSIKSVQMKFILTLNLPEAEQEAVWLQEHLQERRLQDLQSEVLVSTPISGSMSGGLITNMLQLIAPTAVSESIKGFIGFLFEHFKGKGAKLELSGTCPETGRELKLSFDTKNGKDRDQAIAEFERTYNALCRPIIGSNEIPNEG
jgi:hypothetical protein